MSEVETLEHLFLLCPWTQPVWFGLEFVSPPSPVGLTTINQWVLDVLDSPSAREHDLASWIFYTFWCIWKARNEMVFNNKHPYPLNTLHEIKTQCSEYLKANSPNLNVPNQPSFGKSTIVQAPPSQWRPPRENCVKINSDAAFDHQTGKGFSGIICRDFQGRFLTAAASRFFANSPLVAEAMCLREAVSLAVNLRLESVIFESDNQILVEVCRKNVVRREIFGIVEDINVLRSNFSFSGFTWTKREGNNCAHVLASLAKDDALHGAWTLRPPPLLRRAMVSDAQALWR